MNTDIASQLSSLSPEIRTRSVVQRKDPIQIVARVEEGEGFGPGTWIEFKHVPGEKKLMINNNLHLFSQLKEAMRRLTKDYSWSIRYASQIRRENMPFLHSSNTKCIMFDPFMAFRDPVREFFHSHTFLWQIFESNSYYFKTQQAARDVSTEIEMLKQVANVSENLMVDK
jgi:hypothetical protein